MPAFLSSLFQLRGKVAMLTGAGGHLVSEFGRALARTGTKVVALDKAGDRIGNLVSELDAAGADAWAFRMDVTKKADWKRALAGTLKRYARVDILVNGAGINAPTPFLAIKESEWNKILSVQLTGTMLGCQVVGKEMLRRKSGSIINISSASSGPPLSKAFAYSVAKAGVKNLTQNLAREWGPHGVRVNALRPGFFPTEWSRRHFLDETRIKAIHDHTPMRRFGQPSELVGMVLLLASEASSFVTGAEIPVDGGFTAMTI